MTVWTTLGGVKVKGEVYDFVETEWGEVLRKLKTDPEECEMCEHYMGERYCSYYEAFGICPYWMEHEGGWGT